ncbi:MAG: hypothetical protein ACYSU0_03105, partial [Planctomycetota bacterium]
MARGAGGGADPRVRCALLAAAALLIAAFPLMAAADPSPEIRKQIETDWQRQEQVTRRLSYGDHRALDGVLRRGRLMIEDMRELGARVACDRAAEALD